MPKRRIIHNFKEMKQFANHIAASLKSGDVIGLVGELGAGKTTFVQHLAQVLGVKDRVVSPTFLMMRIYQVGSQKHPTSDLRSPTSALVHLDAYRIRSTKELEAIGVTEYIGLPNTITVIEWADRVKSALPRRMRWIVFKHGKHQHERIVAESNRFFNTSKY